MIYKFNKSIILIWYLRYYITCRAFPNCKKSVWLPSCIIEASVSDEYCQSVTLNKILF